MNTEQVTNEHYQKILAKRISFKYPKLSFEAALEAETQHADCLCLIDTNPARVELHLLNKNVLKPKHIQILGRPITICEIVDMLNKSGNEYFYDGQGNIVKYMWTPSGYIHAIKVTLDSKSRFLHEQSIEVQEKIANLIF